jgi:hypothetical protein
MLPAHEATGPMLLGTHLNDFAMQVRAVLRNG